jgi:hypothetical protein
MDNSASQAAKSTTTSAPSESSELKIYRNPKYPEGYSNPISHITIPQHPFMAANGKSNYHNDAYMSDTYEVSGPLGLNPKVKLISYGSDIKKIQMAVPITIAFDSKGRIVMSILSILSFRTSLIDHNTLQELATINHPPRWWGWVIDPLNPLRDTSGGTYFILDNQDNILLATWDDFVKIIKYNDSKGEFELVRSYNCKNHLMPVAFPARDRLQMTIPDWQGKHLWFFTRYGKVGAIDLDSGQIHSIELKGEEIQNSATVGEDGVYIVSDHATYRFHAGEDGTPIIDWRTEYDRGTQLKPAMMSQGSGQTPTLMGDLVVIGDNADLRTNMYFLKRSDGSVVCNIPIFPEGASCSENSVQGFAHQGKNGMEYSFCLDNHWGLDRLNMFGPGGIGRSAVGGLTRIDLVPDANGKYSCHTVWTNPVISGSGTPKISLANGLVYIASNESLPDGNYSWGITAVDWVTGETVYRIPFGYGMDYTNFGSEIAIDPHGSKLYVGRLGGLVIVEDSPH